MGLSPAGHGFPSCPTSRCLSKALMRCVSRGSVPHLRQTRRLWTCEFSSPRGTHELPRVSKRRVVRTYTSFSNWRSGNPTVRGPTAQEHFHTFGAQRLHPALSKHGLSGWHRVGPSHHWLFGFPGVKKPNK